MTAARNPDDKADPLEGREVEILNSMLMALIPLARAGDGDAIDRVLKIMDLKRRFRKDKDWTEL